MHRHTNRHIYYQLISLFSRLIVRLWYSLCWFQSWREIHVVSLEKKIFFVLHVCSWGKTTSSHKKIIGVIDYNFRFLSITKNEISENVKENTCWLSFAAFDMITVFFSTVTRWLTVQIIKREKILIFAIYF